MSGRASRGQFFRREIVDRDGRRNGVGRVFQLRRLGRTDSALLDRLIDVANARGVHAVADRLHGDRLGEGALEQRKSMIALGFGRMEQVHRQTVARRARLGDEFGAAVGDAIGGSAPAAAERQDEEAQQPADRPDREIGENLVEARLDGGKACLHAPFEQRKIIRLPAFVVPALERCARQIKLGENVAEARRQHFLAL